MAIVQGIDDIRVGSAFRAVRFRKRWRQKDVAERAGVSAALVSLIERGHIGSVSVDALRRIGAVIDVRVDIVPRWRAGELDRLLNARHSFLEDAVAGWLAGLGGWIVAPEVSFAVDGERGWIDLLAWHSETRTLLVIEIKTEIVDIQNLIGVLDRKVRLAPLIARGRGWLPATVASWLVIAEGATNRRRVALHAQLLRSAFPTDGRKMRSWLRDPAGRVAALSFFSNSTTGSGKRPFASRQRVRLPRAAIG